ncbi:Golgi membrane protein 1 [Choloepus didactylus]|uniref:Golgi membrane protein 1 n=1 Tax=Choloepus didactylus TaxID=27675 RepID=UPI0018A064DA|nr:Golgi membrane protein 1 [Choloepus didactylus]XP_037653876.1 Golgi membrane protein 1 [Choloepus didactylus]XP_037653877.1 Golgi membrane protein 1 [Choloepus didactylus]
MMGLGNGRRSMKAPPVVLAALVACIIVLGFNYWIASSRSVDLQMRIMELEGSVRRAAVERGAVELKKNEFQGELEKQREQLDKIQSSHSFQLESVNKLYQDEKAVLVNNITTGEKLIRTLQDQLKSLQKNYGKLQHEVLQFQKNQTNLERKFSYDLNQCINQMKEVKEQCEERIEEVTKKGNEAAASRELNEKKDPSQQLQVLSEPQPRAQAEAPEGKENLPSNVELQTRVPSSETALDLKRQEETNEIQVVSEEELRRDSLGLPQQPGQELAVEKDKLAEERGVGEAQELGQTSQAPAALLASQENQETEGPKRDQLVVVEAREEQDADEEGRNQQKLGDDDYNMDENEAESETDKQAALAGSDKNLNVLNAEDQKRDTINLLDQREKRNHTL